MGYLVINKTGLKSGDVGKVAQLTSASYAFQVVGGTAEFSGSNVPDADVTNDALWVPMLTIKDGTPDTQDFRQYVWGSFRYKVTAGTDVGIYVNVGGGS